MYQLKIFIIASVLCLSSYVHSQKTYNEVDSVSYALYSSEDWSALATFGTKAIENGYDYYYLNVRTGIAYFKLEQFEKAQIYFQKALQNNSSSLFAQEYLFWTYYNLEEEEKASKLYKSFPDSIKNSITNQNKKPFDFLFVESGIKLSGNPTASKNIYYGSLSLHHKFSARFDLYQSYIYMYQEAIWGKMRQQQYILTPSIKLNNKWRISTTFNYSNYKSELLYSDNANWTISTPNQMGGGKVDSTTNTDYFYNGSYFQNSLLIQLNLNKRLGNWSFTPHASMYNEWATPSYTRIENTEVEITTFIPFSAPTVLTTSESDSSEYRTQTTFQSWQFGFDLNRLFAKRISLGADLNFVAASGVKRFNISPYFRVKLTDKISISGYYVAKKNYLLSLNGGATFLNSYDVINSKFSLSGEFNLSKKIQLFTTYQHESVVDNLSLREYKLNTLFLGLKIKL